VRLPLADLRIIAVEQYGAGPFGSSHLADLGAEVIKIEDPSVAGDVGRTVPPYANDGDSLFFEAFNRGKKSVALDLNNSAGRRVFEDLVRRSDAVYSNLRGDVPAKIGITYRDLAPINPAIVCCSLSGYGMTGPRSNEPGYDYVVQALTGWMDLTGEPDGPPTKSGLSLVDFSAGYVAALALLAGVMAARRDGIGTDCDISLYDTAMAMLSYPGVWHLNAGYAPTRTHHSAHPSIIPFQAFEASDGWLVIAAPKEKFWQRFCQAAECDELIDDPRFATLADRQRNRAELMPLLEAVLAGRSVAEWVERFSRVSVPCGPVRSVAEAFADPHTVARGTVVEAEHPRYGTIRTISSPVRVGPSARPPVRAPRLGEHTEQILTDLLGYTGDELAEARADGAFGAPQ